MIKNKMAKLVGTAMAATLMFSAVAPVVASADEIAPKAAQEENIDREQLGYAIEEMRIAIDLLDNENLIDRDNYNRMIIFANTAVQRVQRMDQENEYVKDIYRLAGEISSADNAILRRVMNDVECLKNASEDTKEDWIDALNEAITYAMENNLLNDATLRAAIEVLHTEAGLIEAKEAQEENVDNEQLGYAIEEMRIAIDLLDSANLIDRDNYNRMVVFANTAVQRVQSMDQENEYVKDIYRLAGEISSTDNAILRRVMNDVECLKNASEDTKEDWIDALNEAITYAMENYLLNDATLRAAIDVLHEAAGVK